MHRRHFILIGHIFSFFEGWGCLKDINCVILALNSQNNINRACFFRLNLLDDG